MKLLKIRPEDMVAVALTGIKAGETVPYDGMIFCFFGMSEEILEIAARQCQGTVRSHRDRLRLRGVHDVRQGDGRLYGACVLRIRLFT